MDGHSNHGYIQDDMAYDDLMNGAGWPANNDQQFNYQHPPQDQYIRYTTNQGPYENFDLNQAPSYPSMSYANSPYTAQYQNSRQGDVFGHTPFGVETSLAGSNYHGHESSFSFAPQAESATISPQSLQYSMPPTSSLTNTISNTFQQQPTTTSSMATTFAQRPEDHSALYYNNVQNGNNQINQANTVHYPSLPNGAESDQKLNIKRLAEEDETTTPIVQQVKSVPPPQNPLRTTRPELLAKQMSVRPPIPHVNYIRWEDKPTDVTLGLKNTLPKYHARKSRSGKDLIPGLDASRASSTPTQPSVKRGRPPKEPKLLVSKYKGTSQGSRPLSDKVIKLREDGTSPGSPSTTTETSSSEQESSSEEESEYEEEEEMEDISKIRGDIRPTATDLAARWDAIGIIWKGKYANPSADAKKEAIEKYGNFVSALRLKIKTNSTKIDEAASRPAELQRLKNERRVLLDSLYQTVDAANVHGCMPIVENLGGHHKLVNGLTTTLIECIKADDFQGRLPKAVFSLLAKFKTMTDELLKKLKFDSIQKRWNKKGDDETKKLIVSILANTTDAKERAAKTEKVKVEEERKIKEKSEISKNRVPESSNTGLSSSTKRPLEGDNTNGKPSKKFASSVAGAPVSLSSSKPLPPKRPAGNLLGIASKPIKSIPKKREPSPPTESKLGALLASIEKPPEAPKAPEAPPRAPETPEEKARRERKESRRHLRVKFKEGSDLEEIRLFKHEQAEDEGRQDEMLRDAHDDRLEGMMHKKRVAETIDDEEEYQPMDIEVPYAEPVSIDLSSLEKPTQFGPAFVTRGGNRKISTPEQETQQRREAVELMVIYTDPSDIPPSPKEPPQVDGSRDVQERELKTSTEPWFQQRLQLIHQYGPEKATHILLTQREEQVHHEVKTRDNLGQTRSSQISLAPTAPPSSNVVSILQQLSQPAKSPTVDLPKMDQSALETNWANLQRIVNSLKGKPYPPTEPPEWMSLQQRQHWFAGYNRDKALREKREAEQKAAVEMQRAHIYPIPPTLAPTFQQQVAPPPPPMMPFPMPVPQMSTINPQVPDVAQQVQNILAGYQMPGPKAAPLQQFDYNSFASMASAAQNDYTGQGQQCGWDGDWNEDKSGSKSGVKNKQRGYGSKPGYNPKAGFDSPFDENGEYKGKKKPCRFYQEGKCTKGDACTYLHD